MGVRLLKCEHCNTDNLVAECGRCARSYVITTAHVEGRLRDFDAGPVSHLTHVLLSDCDFCLRQSLGDSLETASAGLRQRTCASCHTEFLTEHGR